MKYLDLNSDAPERYDIAIEKLASLIGGVNIEFIKTKNKDRRRLIEKELAEYLRLRDRVNKGEEEAMIFVLTTDIKRHILNIIDQHAA